MSACEQTKGMTILQHGESVAEKYKQLIAGDTSGWRLPDWDLAHLIKLQPHQDVMELYHIYHDCGKPYCRTIDEEGRQHFPNHSQISASIWRVHFNHEQIAQLIQHDMDMHLLKPADAAGYEHLDMAPALLLTALSEIHANAGMFSGIESTSFKIKFKQLEKTGKRLCDRICARVA